jgi:thymidylate kinase
MVISISGMVGSGKTTVAARLAEQLRRDGHDVTSLSFQTLPCFSLLKRRSRTSRETPSTSATTTRWAGYKRKRLTLIGTLVYVMRILAFRLYRLRWSTTPIVILNRYFYDVFVHYHLRSSVERFYFSLLHHLIPVPDISILLVAPVDIIAGRRPTYDREYLSLVHDAYERLSRDFPEIVTVHNTAGNAAVVDAERVIRERSSRTRHG